MFGKTTQKILELQAKISYLENKNIIQDATINALGEKLSQLENPAKYSIGYELKKRYLITGSKWVSQNYLIAENGGFRFLEGWRYDVFDKEENKPTTLWEDQVTKFIDNETN